MNPAGKPNHSVDTGAWRWSDWLSCFVLFLATAGVVIWQNSRLGVLWDLSYTLENSYRISLGDVPYRDFPLPHAPLTFLVQAALIRLSGRVFFHHVLYCAVVGGLATVLTWRILLNLLRGTVSSARPVAFMLSVPLATLGVYSIFPHPSYDPDCTFAILVGILLLQQLEHKGFPLLRSLLTGMLLVVPMFIKQNTGLAFLGGATVTFAILAGFDAWRMRVIPGYTWIVLGAAAGLGLALILIHSTAGLGNYKHWTIDYAASRRTPSLAEMLAVYQNPVLPWWIAGCLAGALLLWLDWHDRWMQAILSGALMSVPFICALVYLVIEKDSAERVAWLLTLWPFLMVVAFVFAVWNLPREAGMALALPFILICTVHGAFLSHQLWCSTYSLWPLFILLTGSILRTLLAPLKARFSWGVAPLTSLIAVSLLVTGGYYAWSHERLDYAKLSEHELARPTLPALAGLSVRGSWIPDFEELVRFVELRVPEVEGLIMIPGEDLFYYTTGRHPRFPVLMFDHTVNPYSPQEILELSRIRGIGWLVVKRDLQLEEDPVENKEQLLELLRREFKQVESLDNYDVYRRRAAGAGDDDRWERIR